MRIRKGLLTGVLLATALVFAGCGSGSKEKRSEREKTEAAEEAEKSADRDEDDSDKDSGDKDSGDRDNSEKDSSDKANRDEPAGSAYGAYARLVEEKEAEYGAGTYAEDGIPYLSGVGFLHLVDFDGDGTEELILAHGTSFEQTIEVYASDGDEARMVYEGGALMYGMDTPLVEIWEGAGPEKYLLVNKGDYFDGRVSFLTYDGAAMTEDHEGALANPGEDGRFTRAESFALNFGGADENETKQMADAAEERLAQMHEKLGQPGGAGALAWLKNMGKDKADGEEAAGTEENQAAGDADAAFAGAGTVLVDDEELTILCHGKTMIRMNDGEHPVYCLTVTNNSPWHLELSDAHLNENFVHECGTVDGARIIATYFVEKENPAPKKYDVSKAMTFPGIPAGATMELYMEILCSGYGLQTEDDLVNVSANINTSHGTGDSFAYRNYTLQLNQGESAPGLAEGYEKGQHRYFTFTYPAAWQYETVGEQDDYGRATVSLPPQYNDHGMSTIIITYDNLNSAEASAQKTADFYRSDNYSDGNYTVDVFNTEINGRTLVTVEVFGKLSDSRFRFYNLDLPDGNTLTIETSVELPFLSELDGEYEKLLQSIEWQ